MKKIFLGVVASAMLLGGLQFATQNNFLTTKAETLAPSLYSKIATAINAAETNAFEINKNPELFDSTNQTFIGAVQARKDVETYASSIEASSAYDFSKKYAETFALSVDTNAKVYETVTADVAGKFKRSTVGETYKQKIESYEYYYWFTQKYVVNIDWGAANICDALSDSFKRELNSVNDIISAKKLLQKYGSHVYSTYILGGKLEITKYFVQEASYELSESEKSMSVSLNVIVETSKVDAKVNGSVDLSSYESNSQTSSNVFTKLDYHAYGGNTNGAATASDLFQYKTQFGTGTASGFLYEAWTNSFNNDNADLKVILAEGSIPIWDVLDNATYGSKKELLHKAFDNMSYESYATKCGEFGVACNYFSSLDYVSRGSNISVVPYETSINLPDSTQVTISLSDLVTDAFNESDYNLALSSDGAATLSNNVLTIKPSTVGMSFDILLNIYGLKAYSLTVYVKKEFYSGGYGTSQQPYLLSNKTDFISFLATYATSEGADSTPYFKVANDIDLGGEKLDVGGSSIAQPFEGILDGGNHAIKNFTINASTFSDDFYNIGIFGANNGVIKNLVVDSVVVLINGSVVIGMEDVQINCGILAGTNTGVINNCRIVNSSIRMVSDFKKNNSEMNLGGITGLSSGLVQYSSVMNCCVLGITTSGKGKLNVGGLIGVLNGSTLEKSYIYYSVVNANNVKKETTYALGGLVGIARQYKKADGEVVKAKIDTCLVANMFFNKDGGRFGYVAGFADGVICTNCYYAAKKEQSIENKKSSGCTRKNELSLAAISNASFNEEWVDGQYGPVLAKHVSD